MKSCPEYNAGPVYIHSALKGLGDERLVKGLCRGRN